MSTPTQGINEQLSEFGWEMKDIKLVNGKKYKHIAYATAGILMISDEAFDRMLETVKFYNIH